MLRWMVLLSAVVVISGCQCVGVTECYQDKIDHISEYGPNCEWLYFPRLDISRRRCCPNGNSCPDNQCRLFADAATDAKSKSKSATSVVSHAESNSETSQVALRAYFAEADASHENVSFVSSKHVESTASSAVAEQKATSKSTDPSSWLDTIKLTTFQKEEVRAEEAPIEKTARFVDQTPETAPSTIVDRRAELHRPLPTTKAEARPFPSNAPTATPMKNQVMHAPLGVKPPPSQSMLDR